MYKINGPFIKKEAKSPKNMRFNEFCAALFEWNAHLVPFVHCLHRRHHYQFIIIKLQFSFSQGSHKVAIYILKFGNIFILRFYYSNVTYFFNSDPSVDEVGH